MIFPSVNFSIPNTNEGTLESISKDNVLPGYYLLKLKEGQTGYISLANIKKYAEILDLDTGDISEITSGKSLEWLASVSLKWSRSQLPVTLHFDNSEQRIITSVTSKAKVAPNTPTEASEKRRGTAAAWPDPDKVLPFVPVPVFAEPNLTRIGYATFDNPITHITHSRTSHMQQMGVMRGQGTLKKGTGQAYENFTITYLANGPAEIYRSVQEVLEQITLTPFITAEGGPFGFDGNGAIPCHELAVRNFSISTVDGLPNTLQVEINFDPFDWQTYLAKSNGLYEINSLDDAICWPLFKVWAKTKSRSRFTPSTKFNGELVFSYPNSAGEAALDELFAESTVISTADDYSAIHTLHNLVNGGEVLSKNVKKVDHPLSLQTGTSFYVIKVSNEENFKKFAGYSEFAGNIDWFFGLVNWDKLSAANIVDSQGRLTPQSANASIDYFNSTQTKAFQPNKDISEPTDFLDIATPRHVANGLSINSQIETFILTKNGFASLPASSDPSYPGIKAKIDAAQRQPWREFGIVVKVEPHRANDFRRYTESLKKTITRENYVKYDDFGDRVRKAIAADGLKSIYLSQDDTDVIIERIAGSRGHNLAIFSQRGNPLPTHQYMGGMDSTFVVQGTCFGTAAKKKLETIKQEFDERCIFLKSQKILIDTNLAKKSTAAGNAFLHVKNEIFNLLGVEFVMPVTLHFENVDQQPDVWNFSLTLIEFDPSLKKAEEVNFLPTTWDNIGKYYQYGWNENGRDPILDKAIEYGNLQSSLSQLEAYPDLRLPTRGELDFWINSIQKGAQSWVAGQGVQGFRNKAIRPEEQYIINLVADQFYPIYAKRIANGFSPKPTELTTNASPYVDPDFYIYYDPNESFGTIFDGLSAHLMGKGPQDKSNYSLHAPGRSSSEDNPGELPISGYREYDPNYKLMTSYSPEFWSANPEAVSFEKEFVEARELHTYPRDRAAVARKTLDDLTTSQLDNDPNAWWTDRLNGKQITFYGEGKRVRLNPEQEKLFVEPIVPDNVLDFQSEDESKPRDENSPVGDLGDYFKISWRQKLITSMNLRPKQISRDLLGTFGQNRYFYLKNPERLTTEGAGNVINPTPESFFDLTLANIEKSILEMAQYYSSPPPNSKVTSWQGGLETRPVPPSPLIVEVGPAFVIKSALVKASYNAATDTHPFVSTTGVGSIVENWHFFEGVAKANQLDPNLLRAVFMRRDGFGQFTPLGSPENAPGDMIYNENYSSYEKAVRSFAKLLRKNLNRFNNIPSIALIASNMEVTSQARAQYYNELDKDIQKDVLEDLLSFSSEINSNPRSIEALSAINRATNKYSLAGFSLDEYYGGYISLARVYGTYALSSIPSDVLFDPLNPIILKDVGDINGDKIIVTKYTPSASEISIGSSRTSVDLTNPEVKPDVLANGSIEIVRAMAKKMRSALDPSSEGALYGSLIDFRRSPIGKFKGAFPSFQIILINEGFYWASGNKKLWDQFYTRTGVSSIEIHRTREMPGGTASVTFSNMFHNITNYALQEAMAHEMAIKAHDKMGELFSGTAAPGRFFSAIGDIWSNLVLKNIPEDVIKIWQNNHLKKLALGVGTRLQIRMGYGSNLATYDVVFNGGVVDAPVDQGYVTLTAVSDGHELEKPTTTRLQKVDSSYAFVDGGAFGGGADPSSIVTGTLVSATLWDNITGGNYRDMSNGIAHFGEVYYNGTQRYPAEVQINIYSPRLTTIEQGLSEIHRYNIINGITNWGNEQNLFSVSVQEPTPWKVLEVCRRACLDFVASAEPFASRSTVFFGKWWWPYHYGYSSDIYKLDRLVGAGFYDYGASFKKNQMGPSGTKDPSSDYIQKDPKLKNVPTRVIEKLMQAISASADKYSTSFVSYQYIGKENTIDNFRRAQETADRGKYLNGDALESREQAKADENYWQNRNTYLPPNEDIYKFRVLLANGQLMDLTINDVVNEQSFANPVVKEGVITVPKGATANSGRIIGSSGTRMSTDFLHDVENLVNYLEWKPFMQAYIAHSGINLLDNNIRADSTRVWTDAVGLHMYNGWITSDSVTKTIAFSLDTDIHPGDRKTLMVDTGIMLTGLQAGGQGIAGEIASLPGKIPLVGGLIGLATDPLANYIKETPTTPAIENSVVSALLDTAKNMYAGWFTILGQPTMKPRDLVLLTDHVTDLRGPVFVKDVIHRMDVETGFVTLVSPDAVVLPHSSIVGQQIVCSLSTGILHRIGSFWITKAAAVGLFASVKELSFNKKYSGALSNDIKTYERLLKSKANSKVSANATIYDSINKTIEDRIKAAQSAAPQPSLNAKGVTENSKEIQELQKFLRDFRNRYSRLDSDNLSNLIRFAQKNGIDIADITDATLSKADTLFVRMVIFEENLKKEHAQMVSDVIDRKVLAGLDTEEALIAVDKIINEKRAAFISTNRADVDAAVKLISPDKTAVQLQTELKNLLNERDLVIRNAKSADVPHVKALDEDINKVLLKLQASLDAADVTPAELDTEIRRLLSTSPNGWLQRTLGVLGNVKDASKKGFQVSLNSLIESPLTLFRGIAKGTGALITSPIEGVKTVRQAWSRRDLTAILPGGKTNVALKVYEYSKKLREAEEAGQVTKEVADALIAKKRLKAAKFAMRSALKTSQAIFTGVRILKYMGPQAVISLAADATIFLIWQSVIEGHNARLRARQCAKIIPLMAGNVPFVAGIRGHQGAVIGDNPSWVDELVSGLHGAPNGLLPQEMSSMLLFASALNGVELPQYGSNPFESAYLQKIREEVATENVQRFIE